jgi:Gly-Xaa carboxypeptidase
VLHLLILAPHTGIGLLALAINELEVNPVPAHMDRKNPLYSALQCYAHYGKLDKEVKDVLKKTSEGGKKGEKALKKLTDIIAKMGGVAKAHVTTTRAVDIVRVGLNQILNAEVSLT